MRKVLILSLLLGLVTALVPAAMAQPECDDAIGCVVLEEGDPIVIASALASSGAVAFLGEDSGGGIEIAIEERDGMLLDREIELVQEDSLCSAEGGQTAAQRIAADEEIIGMIGTNCSSAAQAALPIISDAGMVMISSSATSPALANPNTDEGGAYLPGFYRTAHNDLTQGAIAAQHMFEELGATTLATIHDGSPYADGLQIVASDTFAEMGGEVTFQGAVNIGDTDMSAILTEIASNPPDVLYFPIFEPEGNFIAAQSADTPGLEDTTLYGADGILIDSFPENTGDASLGMYFSGPVVSGEEYQAFLTQWEEVIGGVPPAGFHAHAYDGTRMLFMAIEEVATEGEDGTLVIGRQALRDALTAIEGFEGLTGSLTCSEFGDCATGEALGVFQITEAELNDGNWPPPVVWTPRDSMDDMEGEEMDMEATEEMEMEATEESDG